jgi:hypothetical protein
MIISHGRRYLFVHIPKTGGTAMATALEARAMKDDILIGDTPKAQKRKRRLKDIKTAGRLWKHSTLADIDGLICPDEFDQFFIFTLVRNPWDRMVSYYRWLRMQNFDHLAVRLAHQLDFATFLNDPRIRTAISGAPYGSYLRDCSGTERHTHFIRLEHLAEDMAPLEAHLGFCLDEIPQVNASERERNHRDHYDHATRDVVAELCREDIARFGYSF